MIVLGWIAAAVFTVGYVYAWRKEVYRIAYKQAREWCNPRPDAGNVAVAVVGASMLAVIWPVLLLVRFVYERVAANDPERLVAVIGSEPREQKRRRREASLREREQRVRDLERELGVKP